MRITPSPSDSFQRQYNETQNILHIYDKRSLSHLIWVPDIPDRISIGFRDSSGNPDSCLPDLCHWMLSLFTIIMIGSNHLINVHQFTLSSVFAKILMPFANPGE